MRSPDPPRLATWLLEHATSRYRRECLTGDLLEEYRARRSNTWYWRQVLWAIAANASHAVRARSPARTESSLHWREYRGLLVFLILMCGFRSAWADWVYVPTGSMNPTILEGDRLLVNKHVYGLRVPFSLIHLTTGEDPVRGDIIVFDSPRGGTSLVKRVVAVPGDTVTLDGDRLSVNGALAHYAAGEDSQLRNLLRATQAHNPVVLRESGVVREHNILLLPDRRQSGLVGPIIVPPGMFFVLGDNRDNSADSRYIGFVPRRNIVGRATRVLVSLNPDRYYAPRLGRLLDSLY